VQPVNTQIAMPTMQKVELSPGVGPTSDARSKAPVFVLGCPRSGTTLLYHMLLSAGNFAVYRAESQVLNLLEPRFGDLNVATNRRKLLAAWRDTELFRRTGLEWTKISEEVMAKCRNGGDFLRIVMESIARRQGLQRWADCTPEHLLYLDRIKRTISEALVIHIIRDGRDVALSLEKQAWIRPFVWDRHKTLEVAILYWEWIVNRGRDEGRALGSNYIEVRYEDLVTTPRKILEDVGAFIGQELDYEKIERVGIGSVSRPNSSFLTEIKDGEFGPVGRWKSSLPAVQLERLEVLAGSTLGQLGYELHAGANASSSVSVGSLRRMRGLYHRYFDMKLRLKKRTPFARMLVSHKLPRFGQPAEES
jgi:sulfotransferase family protein